MDSAGSWSRTERLELRPWRADEAERLFDIRRRVDIAKWLGDPKPWTDLATAHDKIAEWHDQTLGSGPIGVWAIASSTEVVGTVSLGHLPDDGEIEIGWYLHPDSHGQGFASEAAAALLGHAISSGIERVWAIMWPHNDASARDATAIGMDDLGIIEDKWYGTDYEPTSRIFRTEA